MLQRDYILEIVGDFVEGITDAFRRALGEEAGRAAGVEAVEQQIGDLLELDHETALSLAPDSLVTMMVLSGMGDSVAAYVCYALDRLGTAYERQGDADLAGLRRAQATAVAESFACDPADVPSELASLDGELFS